LQQVPFKVRSCNYAPFSTVVFQAPQGYSKKEEQMAKSATFSVLKASAHSSEHNSRDDIPDYLIGAKNGEKNIYDLRHSDSDFLELAKVKYQEVTGQKMQQKQIDALIKETVLTLEDHHTKADVQKVFNQLNEKYGGHYITELSIHKDEGHFEDKNGVTYYPTKDILQKEDGWYIVPLDQSLEMKPSYKPKVHEFSEKVDINDFKPIHNIHAHVKFSMFDLQTGKTGRMKHNELNDRIKTASKVLGLDYNPEKGSKKRTPVEQIKTQHKAVRNEKIKALAKGIKSELSISEKYDSLPIRERQEMRVEMRAIIGNSIETDTLNKRLELSEKENKSLKEEIQALKEAQKEERKEQGATRADYAQMEAKYKAEIAQLKAGNALKTAVDVSKEIEEAHTKIGEMARMATSNDEAIEELEKAIPTDDPKKVAIAVYNSHIVADTGIMGKLGGEKKDTDLLIVNMAKEIEKRDKLLKKAVEVLKKTEISKMSVSNAIKNVVESSKKHLEAIFSKITGKSISEVQKERTEILNAQKEKPKGLREAVDELNKQKEPKNGMER
jgi:hypothetical protein